MTIATLQDLAAIYSPQIINVGANHYTLSFPLMKFWPALHIIERALDRGLITAGTTIVESSSGTMALALAIVCWAYGLELIIVTDPVVEPPLQRHMEALGARVEVVHASISDGNVQMLRMARLNELLAMLPKTFWVRQYDNPDNPSSYARIAGEVIRKIGKFDFLVAAVGSGGSACGLKRSCQRFFPVTLVGVDTFGSVIFGQEAGPRPFRGLGNSYVPGNVDHREFDDVHWVGAHEGFQAATRLLTETTLKKGPTSGAAYMVGDWYAKQQPGKTVLSVLPDDGHRYEHTIFNPAWMRDQNYLQQAPVPNPTLISHPNGATSGWAYMKWDRSPLSKFSQSHAMEQRAS